MWTIPPIVGQKVMLDPSYGHYSDFNRTQAKGSDGYILAIDGMSLTRWLLGASSPGIRVLWENGHMNSYELNALLPIDAFKIIERVEFKSGHFQQVFNQKTRDYIAERVILKNDDIAHYSMFDKEKRLEILNKAVATYVTLDEDKQNKEAVQMRYMATLEEVERTKRTEPVVLFLDTKEDNTATPKKHQASTLENSSDQVALYQHLLKGSNVGIVDSDFFNPCVEIMPEHFTGYGVDLTANIGAGVSLSPHMEEMERLGEESRVREEEEKQRIIQRLIDSEI